MDPKFKSWTHNSQHAGLFQLAVKSQLTLIRKTRLLRCTSGEHLSDVFLYHRFKQSKTSSGGVLPVLKAELVPTHNSLKLQLIRQLF